MISTEKNAISTEKNAISTEKNTISTRKNAISTEGNKRNNSCSFISSVVRLYRTLEYQDNINIILMITSISSQ